MSPSATIIDDDSSDASSVISVDVKELLDSWTTCYGTPKTSTKGSCPDSCLDASTTSEASLEGSWRFDLGALETTTKTCQRKGRSGGLPLMPSTLDTVPSNVEDEDDSENSDGLFSEMEEATLAMQAITRRTFEHSQSTAMETSKSSFETSKSSFDHSFRSREEDEPKEDSLLFENSFVTANSSDTTKVVVEPANPELEQRRAARAARMEKVRQRIAREKEEARAKKEEKERKLREDEVSEEARRKNAYEWYCRLGMIPKKELKRRIKLLGPDAHVFEADLDLLPWNFNGSMVNTNKLNKLGIK